jgi:hypothetical protein
VRNFIVSPSVSRVINSPEELPVRKTSTVLLTAVLGLAVVTPNAYATASPSDTALLITGDQIVRREVAGRPADTVLPATESGLGRVLVHLNLGRRSYEIPAAALPYLGRGLDWSLFDVDAVLKAQRDGQLSVRTAGRGQTVDVAAAKDFGAELVRRYLDDRTRGAFGEFTPAVSLPDTQPMTVTPRSVMRTLTVTANGPDGKPDTGDTAIVYNTDDGNLFDSNEFANPFYQGVAKFSVPEGHYSVLGLFFETDADGNVTAVRYSAQPELTVSTDTSVKVDAQRANSKVTWVTPRPALLMDGGFVLRREPTTGPALTVDVATGPGVPVWVSPMNRAVTTGKMQSYPYNRLVSPPGPGTPYEYQLQVAATGTIPRQRYVVKPESLATVDAGYYSELTSVGYRQRAGLYPFEDGQARAGHPFNLPARQTEYVSADPATTWYGGLAKYVGPGISGWHGGHYETPHTYRPGQAAQEDWNRFPLHSAGEVNQLDPNSYQWGIQPPAVRLGDTVRLHITPFSDNTPGHTGFGYSGESRDTVTGQYQVTQNGVPVAGGPVQQGAPDFDTEMTVDPGAATLQLTLDASRNGPMYLQSTASHTEWTWPSRHVGEDVRLPDAFTCEHVRFQDPPRNCAVEPLMSVRYAVGGMDVFGTAHTGPQTVDLTFGHLQLASASAITGATAQFSTDGGATWQDATVTALGDGVYRAAFTAEAPDFRGAYVSLRVTATDAAGGRISETTSRSYKIFN